MLGEEAHLAGVSFSRRARDSPTFGKFLLARGLRRLIGYSHRLYLCPHINRPSGPIMNHYERRTPKNWTMTAAYIATVVTACAGDVMA